MVDYTELEPTLDIRTENMIVRLTPDEKDSYVNEAKKLGISLSAFSRLLLRYWQGQIKHP